ncbi:MAG: helix-turn-helix domain-containing protein [bacterium]|nr:helix-turn-helix domain-containing protein [bacterium]
MTFTSRKLKYESRNIVQELHDSLTENQFFLDPQLNMKQVCKLINCSPRKLRSVLKDEMQMKFTDFVNHARINHFLLMVENDTLKRMSIWGIAQESGFGTKNTFYEAFKKIKGTTPANYLRELEEFRKVG